jgi:hypothetical protein
MYSKTQFVDYLQFEKQPNKFEPRGMDPFYRMPLSYNMVSNPPILPTIRVATNIWSNHVYNEYRTRKILHDPLLAKRVGLLK